MPETIKVFNLSTQETVTYYASDKVTPQMAVVLAYEQFTKKNFNTWDYPQKPENHPMFKAGPSGRTFLCGDWGVCLPKGTDHA